MAKINEALLAKMLGLKEIPKKVDDSTQAELKSEIKEPVPVKEKSPSFFSYRQAPEYEQTDDISTPINELKKMLNEYYSEINPITGKPQTEEEYLCELITEARHYLRRGNYIDKQTQLEFVEELENYLLTWQKIRPSHS